MAPNLPLSITVDRNLASTLRNYIQANGGKKVSEAELNNILQKVAKFDAERDAGTREGGSIFSGGSKYLGGSGKDFVVSQGQQIQLSVEEFNEIFKGYLNPIENNNEAPKTDAPVDGTKVQAGEGDTPAVRENSSPVVPQDPEIDDDAPIVEVKPETVEEESKGDNPDGKILEREVNGQKQKISIMNIDGEKVRRAVNEDGTLGETLIPISTAGKNKYITQSKMEEQIRTTLGLADSEPIPEDIKGQYVSIGGEPTLVFKKDGKTMDMAQLNEYVAQIQEQRVAKFDSQLAENGAAEVNDSELLANAQFNVINNKYGDKTGNITPDEYFNYEMSSFDKEELAQSGMTEDIIRGASDFAFHTIDANGDGEISKDELQAFYTNANANKDNVLTTDELEQYGSQSMMARMQPNIAKVVADGYQVQDFEGSPVFVKDGKSYWMNMDGTLGEMIGSELGNPENGELVEANPGIPAPVAGLSEGENPEYDAAVRGNADRSQFQQDSASVRQQSNQRPLPGDINALSPKEQFDYKIEQLKAGRLEQTQIGNKLVRYENGKFVTYDAGLTNRQEVKVSDLEDLL